MTSRTRARRRPIARSDRAPATSPALPRVSESVATSTSRTCARERQESAARVSGHGGGHQREGADGRTGVRSAGCPVGRSARQRSGGTGRSGRGREPPRWPSRRRRGRARPPTSDVATGWDWWTGWTSWSLAHQIALLVSGRPADSRRHDDRRRRRRIAVDPLEERERCVRGARSAVGGAQRIDRLDPELQATDVVGDPPASAPTAWSPSMPWSTGCGVTTRQRPPPP